MAIDLVCGQCQGRLLAEQPGGVVACPHCGTHLQVPGEIPGDSPPPVPAGETPLGDIVSSSLEAAEEALDVPVLEQPVELIRVEASLLEAEPAPVEEPTGRSPSASVMNELSTVATAAAGMPVISTGEPSAPAVVPRSWFFLLASYASAVSLAFVFLLLQFLYVKTHQLESLPDVVPEIRHGEVALKVASPESNVAPGHVLAIGESRRYGQVKVTPLRISRGPLSFEHALSDPRAARAPSAPVLKLWLRFENVSRNQHFPPLDPLLLFKRHYQEFGKPDLTNQFLCRADQRRSDGELRHVFEMSATSEFRIAGQKLETVLGPGQSYETFVPSEEDIDDLAGELVWRVQFRKGYHPRTRHGVTTLIDVPFHRNDVQQDI